MEHGHGGGILACAHEVQPERVGDRPEPLADTRFWIRHSSRISPAPCEYARPAQVVAAGTVHGVRSRSHGLLAVDAVDLARQLASRYDLQNIGLRQLSTPVNDVIAVYSDAGEFALKLYHRNRGPE